MDRINTQTVDYKTISRIPIFNFFEITKTHDYNYLFKDYSGGSEDKREDLAPIFDKISNDFTRKIDDPDIKHKMKKIGKMRFLISSSEILRGYLDLCLHEDTRHEDRFKIRMAIKQIHSFHNVNGDFEKEYKKSLNKCNRLIEQAKTIEKELEAEKKKEEEERLKLSQELHTIEDAAIEYERILNLNFKIDIYKDSLVRWVNYMLKVKEIRIKKAIEKQK